MEVSEVLDDTKRFLNFFGEIERELRVMVNDPGNGKHMTFYQLVDRAKSTNAIIRNYESDLKVFGDFRNLLVHGNNSGLAIPSEKTIQLIEKIYQAITNPPKAYDIAQKSVVSFQKSDSLAVVLETVREKRYTQFPVYEGNNFEGLLTENGVTFWLADKVDEDLFFVKETKIAEILAKDEKNNNYKFISRNKNIYEVQNYFNNHEIEALFVTDSGKEQQKILGIITSWDILNCNV